MAASACSAQGEQSLACAMLTAARRLAAQLASAQALQLPAISSATCGQPCLLHAAARAFSAPCVYDSVVNFYVIDRDGKRHQVRIAHHFLILFATLRKAHTQRLMQMLPLLISRRRSSCNITP